MGWLRELWNGNNKKDWFALYAADGKVDDEVFCNKVKHCQVSDRESWQHVLSKYNLGVSRLVRFIGERLRLYLRD